MSRVGFVGHLNDLFFSFHDEAETTVRRRQGSIGVVSCDLMFLVYNEVLECYINFYFIFYFLGNICFFFQLCGVITGDLRFFIYNEVF